MSQYTARIEPRRSSVRIQAAVAISTDPGSAITVNSRAAYRTRVPAFGDSIERARIVSETESTLNHLILLGAFARPDLICGHNGCELELADHYRPTKNQPYYYRCVGSPNGDINVEGSGHCNAHVEAKTRGSLFYRRKTLANITYSAMLNYFSRVPPTTIFGTHGMSWSNLSQLFSDIQVLMFSDYQRHHGDYLLGSNDRCHHIQMDESKFGKRKNHRGHRVEGIWVFGMVECLIPEREEDRHYRYVNRDRNIDEFRPRYEAGRKFFCTVPNRSGATLLPIIHRHCQRGAIIRSDGWAAYRGLHPEQQLDRDGQIVDNTDNYSQGGFHFRAHQVVNHSVDFATTDNVRGNRGLDGVPSSGMLHTNVIESMWRPLKEFIKYRNRNARDCPGKIMEYLWYDLNKHDLEGAIQRVLREVSFDSDVPASRETGFIPELVTRGEDGNTAQENAARDARDAARLDRWLARRRVRDAEDMAFAESVSDDEHPPTASTNSLPPVPLSRSPISSVTISSRSASNPRGAGRPRLAPRSRGTRSSTRRSRR